MRTKSKGRPEKPKTPIRTKVPKVTTHKIEAIPTPIKLKWDNTLEKYQKNEAIHQWIEHEALKHNHFLNILKGFNNTISDIILKKKIKLYEIDRKIQNDKDKKEKQEFEFKKSIESKVDSALMKANKTLDNIKMMGKSKQSKAAIPSFTQQQTSQKTPQNTITNNITANKHKEIHDIIKKCQDKYVANLELNDSNMKTYFVTLAKSKSLFKDSKERLKRLKQKSKHFGNTFKTVYTNNKTKSSSMNIDQTNTEYNQHNHNVDLVIRLSSILSSELFMKLYLKVIYEIHLKEKKEINEETIYNAFSLWYMLNHLNDLFNTNNFNNDTEISRPVFTHSMLLKTYNEKNNLDYYWDYSSQKVLHHFIIRYLEKYMNYLDKKSNEEDIGVINENAIFSSDFYKCYQKLVKIVKIKFTKFIIRNKETTFELNNYSKEELNYFKNIQCIYANNGSYCCNICNLK